MAKMEMKCACSGGGLFKMMFGAILMAVGLYFGVMGLWLQWGGYSGWLQVMAFYALGLFGMHLGKVMKKSSMMSCPMHGGMMCCK
jgi:hypothetical protein